MKYIQIKIKFTIGLNVKKEYRDSEKYIINFV